MANKFSSHFFLELFCQRKSFVSDTFHSEAVIHVANLLFVEVSVDLFVLIVCPSARCLSMEEHSTHLLYSPLSDSLHVFLRLSITGISKPLLF